MTSKHQISVKVETYEKLKDVSDLTQEPVATIVTKLIHDFLDEEEEVAKRASGYQGEF